MSKIATKPKWYHSWRLWLLGSFSVMGAVYGTVFLVIGLSSKNLQLVGFTFALYFVTFILVMSTWYAVFVRYQDRLFVRILMYDEKGRFQLEMLGTDPKVVKEAKPIPPGEKIDAEKIGVVRFSHTETVKLRIPWEWILLIIVKQATLAWLFMKLVLPALTTQKVKKLLERKPPSWLLTLDSLGNWIGILGLAVALISFFLRFGFLGDVLMLLGMWLGMTGLVASQFLHLALRKLGRLLLICPNCNRSIDRDKFCVYHDEVCKRLGF